MHTRRSRPLHHMFTVLPRRYDLVNHIITLGLDTGWRRKAAVECLKEQPHKVLDLCCGTGDLAITLSQLAKNKVTLIGIDYSQPMLQVATKKAKSAGRSDVPFVYGDVASLPFPDEYFDCIGISFAFRNLTYKNPLTQSYLAEILRVLAVGGRFVIVETSQPKSKLIRKLVHLYLRWFATNTGYLLSGNKEAYRYLAESATHFYGPDEVRKLVQSVGFREFSCRPLFFGTISVYTAIK